MTARPAHATRAVTSIALLLVGTASIACRGSGDRDASARGSASVVAIGQPAPDYAAVTLAHDSASLARERGKVVLLNIWATWCHPCRKEIPVLEQLHRDNAARGFEVIGVSVDAAGEEAKVAAFAREMGMTYPLWHDPDERVSSTFLAVGVPATYLIDRRGTLRWRKIGPIAENDSTLRRAIDAAIADSTQ